jgi:hypothetical protein
MHRHYHGGAISGNGFNSRGRSTAARDRLAAVNNP